jgi:hypothetical protein
MHDFFSDDDELGSLEDRVSVGMGVMKRFYSFADVSNPLHTMGKQGAGDGGSESDTTATVGAEDQEDIFSSITGTGGVVELFCVRRQRMQRVLIRHAFAATFVFLLLKKVQTKKRKMTTRRKRRRVRVTTSPWVRLRTACRWAWA